VSSVSEFIPRAQSVSSVLEYDGALRAVCDGESSLRFQADGDRTVTNFVSVAELVAFKKLGCGNGAHLVALASVGNHTNSHASHAMRSKPAWPFCRRLDIPTSSPVKPVLSWRFGRVADPSVEKVTLRLEVGG
jgi:hypothetical protein